MNPPVCCSIDTSLWSNHLIHMVAFLLAAQTGCPRECLCPASLRRSDLMAGATPLALDLHSVWDVILSQMNLEGFTHLASPVMLVSHASRNGVDKIGKKLV